MQQGPVSLASRSLAIGLAETCRAVRSRPPRTEVTFIVFGSVYLEQLTGKRVLFKEFSDSREGKRALDFLSSLASFQHKRARY